MKKYMTTILAAVIVMSLAACGNADSASADKTSAAETEVTDTTSPVQTEELTEAAEESEETKAPETETPETEAPSDTESETSLTEADLEESESELLKDCYGSWRLVSAAGTQWDEYKEEHGEEESNRLLENMKEDFRFELGDPSYLVKRQASEKVENEKIEIRYTDIWTEFDLMEEDGRIFGHPDGEVSVEDNVLVWNYLGIDFTFEKISDTPEPNPNWYCGDYLLTRVRGNAEGSEWRDPDDKWAFISIRPAGPNMGADGIMPGSFLISLDTENMKMSVKSQETDEIMECDVEFSKRAMTVTTEDLILEYTKD